jgi:hypothetical protein
LQRRVERRTGRGQRRDHTGDHRTERGEDRTVRGQGKEVNMPQIKVRGARRGLVADHDSWRGGSKEGKCMIYDV